MARNLQAGQTISVGPDADVKFLRYTNERDWTCWYCKHLQSRGVMTCDNCGGPKKDDYWTRPMLIITNPAEIEPSMSRMKMFLQDITGMP